MVKQTLKQITSELRDIRPKTKDSLRDYVKLFFGVEIPNYVLTEGHQSAMDYVWFAFNSDFEKTKRRANADCVVWANRGGSKTQTAAIITVLDCIFKPEVQIRILSGSGYQAGRMYEYFEKFLHKNYADLIQDIKTWPTRKTIFKNGAMVEVLVQSETHVRGQHVNKLRCDEIELFKEKVFEAAQYTTLTSHGYLPALELISTKHLMRGLMSKVLKQAKELFQPIFKWNIFDVIKKCEMDCTKCKLKTDCNGKAKEGRGFFKPEDIITQLERTKEMSFYREMLCEEGVKKKWGYRVSYRRY